MYQSCEAYHDVCVEAEEGNSKRLLQLLQCKKLFCFPWLLVPDILLEEYPD